MISTSKINNLPDIVSINNTLVSVSKKQGLDFLIESLIEHNSKLQFFATGGTGQELKKILGETKLVHFRSIDEFTQTPEMQGGLVKTLHPKIFSGLLAEPANEAHKQYIEKEMRELTGSSGVYFDLVVCNFYPFEELINLPEANHELSRQNIDIGGPSMIMAAAKNWHRIAVLTSPEQYGDFINQLRKHNGIDIRYRFELAQKAMSVVAMYRKTIADYFSHLDFNKDVLPGLNLS